MKNSLFIEKIYFLSFFLAITFTLAANVEAVCTIGSNLILNGDAETDSALAGSGSDHDLSNWDTETGSFTVVRYTTGGGFPTVSDPGPASRGTFFFAGGPISNVTSGGTQVINVADCATNIDANRQPYDVSGFFGGFQNNLETATLTLTFKNNANVSLGSTSIGNVTANDRGQSTALLQRSTNGIIPSGTRTVEVTLSMSPSPPGTYNDGYADNLSFVLNTPTAANALISGRVQTADGGGISNAILQLTNTATNETKFVRSGSFGRYVFGDLETGQTYILFVTAKKFSFNNPSRVITLSADLTDEDFVTDSK